MRFVRYGRNGLSPLIPKGTSAIVILPEHLHRVLTLPEDDADYSGRWRAIKSRFTHALRATGVPLIRDNRGEYQLWQWRFWEHTIRDERDYAHHIDYCHWNPMKHGLVQQLTDWPYSSFHLHVRRGRLTPDWAGEVNALDAVYLE
jgi:putative transposase